MADYILREDAIQCAEDIADDLFGEGLDCTSNGARIVAEWLKDIPAADVVEVVRCKDCIHDNSNDPICPIPWVKRMLDSFCSFGERRADNGNV